MGYGIRVVCGLIASVVIGGRSPVSRQADAAPPKASRDMSKVVVIERPVAAIVADSTNVAPSGVVTAADNDNPQVDPGRWF